jgi:TatD DNase family protein
VTLVDSHCHLDSRDFDADREAVIARARAAGVETMLAIGTGEGPPDLEAGLRLAEQHACFLASAGLHPHDAAKADAAVLKHLAALSAHPKIVAVGEIGLDYHYDFAPRNVQQEVFLAQLAIARETGLPVIIHTREAWDDTFALLAAHWPKDGGGIFHCFSGGVAEARRALDLGFHLGFGGIVTYPKATEVHAAARFAPLDRMVVETDAPYLAPAPHRGKRNEPAFVALTARRIAALRGLAAAEVAAATTANFEQLCLRPSSANG